MEQRSRVRDARREGAMDSFEAMLAFCKKVMACENVTNKVHDQRLLSYY
jgi:hypothetical protein